MRTSSGRTRASGTRRELEAVPCSSRERCRSGVGSCAGSPARTRIMDTSPCASSPYRAAAQLIRSPSQCAPIRWMRVSSPARTSSSCHGSPRRSRCATTDELGWRARAPSGRGGVDASADVYRTDVRDDIFFIASTVTGGYFQNIGATRRSGVELALQWRGAVGERAYANYGYTRASFETTANLATTRAPAGETVT